MRAVLRGAGLVAAYALVPLVVVVGLVPWLTADLELRTLLVVKALLVTAGLVLVTCFADRGRPPVQLLLLAGAGCLACPLTWQGRAYMGQLWDSPGLGTATLDLVAWLAVVLATSVVLRQVAR